MVKLGGELYKAYGIIERWVVFQWLYSGSTVALQWLYSGSTVALQWLYNEQKTKEWRTENEPTMKVRRI